MPSTPFAFEHAIEIFVVRCLNDVVLRATTDTWRSFHHAIGKLCVGAGDMVLSLNDAGVKGMTKFPPVTTLVVRRSEGPLRQSLAETTLIIEGGDENLLALAENIDCPNPVEGGHYHSDDWTPGVLPGSVSLVFDHAANPHPL